ncbi:MAG: septum formation protein Maf [Lachnospiraceae bacterium]|nr:septum formation protein Maf [Lachnospiraceae bacterium]
MNKIILASGSPRRKELLSQIGIEYDVVVSNIEEYTDETEPDKIVEALSRQKALATAEGCDNAQKEPATAEGCDNAQKALATAEDCDDTRIILGADTVVSVDGIILGKPSSKEDAYRMLKLISGRNHEVYTGVTLVKKSGEDRKIITFSEKTLVYVKEMTDEEIWNYIESGEPMDKAGAYGIQGRFAAFVEGIDGDYNNIVGLPVSRVYDMLKRLND